MNAIVPFEPGHRDRVVALWRELHPDWTWLQDESTYAKAFEFDGDGRVGYVVLAAGEPVGTAFGSCPTDKSAPRNRYLHLDARPEVLTPDLTNEILAAFVACDEGRAGTWQVLRLEPPLWDSLGPTVEAAGFALYETGLRMEWTGEKVTVVDPGPARIELYTGGDVAIDAAIVNLHNRSYRRMRLTPPAAMDMLWLEWPGLTGREYVLGWDQGKLAGYAEWMIAGDKAIINSITAARSHWGTPLAAAVGTRAMERMHERGHHTIISGVSSRNAASISLQERHGWRIVAEEERRYVRRF